MSKFNFNGKVTISNSTVGVTPGLKLVPTSSEQKQITELFVKCEILFNLMDEFHAHILRMDERIERLEKKCTQNPPSNKSE